MELLSNAKKPEQNINRRRTPQREAICKYISESQSHPSADEIYQALKPQFPSLSLATVYNTLQFLAEEGKINILGHLGDHKLRFDKCTEPHLNLACIACKKVIDLEDHWVHESIREIEGQSGYKVCTSRILYLGVCPDCQEKEKQKEK